MEAAVRAFIKRQHLLKKGQHVVVAVSGGPDSMALLHYLWHLREPMGLVVTAAHINHQLRSEESEADEALVREFCVANKVPFISARVDVSAYAAEHHIGKSLAARELRYQQLRDILHELKADVLATAHHSDDQIETVLMKLVRSANALQAPGIEAVRSFGPFALIRPFLDITKDDILQYCQQHQLPFAVDSSNLSRTYTRNRFRETVLPFVKNENPALATHIQRYHEWQKDDQSYLMELAGEQLQMMLVHRSEHSITIMRDAFQTVDLPLQRRVIHLILNYLYNESAHITSVHIEQTLNMLHAANPSATLELANGTTVFREYNYCHFSAVRQEVDVQPLEILTIPGRVTLSMGELEAEWAHHQLLENTLSNIHIDTQKISLPLSVRSCQPGDRIAPIGMEGTKKLSRLFIDRKVPKFMRLRWPVVVDEQDQIIWVPLLQRSRLAEATDLSANVVRLTFKRETKHLLNQH